MYLTIHHCKVAYCRFNRTHVTRGHKCGRCGTYGHGDFECRTDYLVQNLRQFDNDIVLNNLQCTIDDCAYKELHTEDAHHCPKCGKREKHTIANCPLQISQSSHVSDIRYNVKCPVCRTDNLLNNPRKIHGLTDICSICYENNVEILFPSCYHCCICMQCLHKL
jgi:hypothetical protein